MKSVCRDNERKSNEEVNKEKNKLKNETSRFNCERNTNFRFFHVILFSSLALEGPKREEWAILPTPL